MLWLFHCRITTQGIYYARKMPIFIAFVFFSAPLAVFLRFLHSLHMKRGETQNMATQFKQRIAIMKYFVETI